MSTKVRFVIAGELEQQLMLKAAQAVQSNQLPTEKISKEDVLKLEKRDKHLYVCCQFAGEAFDHLVGIKCRVVGPQCVLSCLELQVAVPNVSHPINNISLQNVVVSCSSVEKARREHLHELLQWMGGRISRDFTDTVTHLVVGEVGSKKYHVAANLKKPIMLPDWIEAAWEESQNKVFCATSDEFVRRYRCPSFKGCIVCVTGLDAANKQEVRKRMEEHGGHYTGELKYNECTHLIVGVARGPKFEFARKWKIHTVSLQWFYDSMESGYCLDEQLYTVQSQDQPTSTPVKDQKQQPRLSTLSNISAINISCIQPVDETAMTEPNLTMETSRMPAAAPSLGQVQDDLVALDKLDLSSLQEDMFLDGCKIFLSGFDGSRLEKLRKIINIGGGTRFNQINENISHVVIGNRIEEHLEELKALPHRPVLVSALWLVECVKQGNHVSEDSYLVKGIWEDEKEKENEVTFKLPTTSNNPKKSNRTSMRKKSDESHDDGDILSQYLPNASNAGAAGDDEDITLVEDEAGNESRRKSSGNKTKDEDETQIDNEPEDEQNEDEEEEDGMNDGQSGGIFAGKRFVILGFPPDQEQDVCQMVPEHGGIVLPFTTRSIPDYAVVPIFGWEVNMTVNEIVTNCWLQMSMEAETVLDPSSNVLFTPVTILKDAAPLTDCVLSISQYCYIERDCLLHIAELLGARCQEYFVRKAVNNLEANTHLLLRDPEGTKFMAAKKWKVPAVAKEWLLACARTGRKQPEKDYLVSAPQASEQPLQQQREADQKPFKAEEEKDSKMVDKPPSKLDEGSDRKTDLGSVGGDEKEAASLAKDEVPQRKDSSKRQEVVKFEEELPKQSATPSSSSIRPIVNKNLQNARGQTPVSRETTPSRILRPGFKPSFDLEDAMADLDSPGMGIGKKGHRRKSSLPLDEFFHQNIANALQFRLGSNSGNGDGENSAEDDVFQEEEPAPGVLAGVVICVSKKLSRKQGDYNAIVTAMGAEYHWTYDEKCTHFIFQGKANDTAKEFRLARSQGKVIVSSHWLLACQEENKRLDEALYPHTYNPKLSLSVVASSSQTPVRSSRCRASAPPGTPLATPRAPKTVAPRMEVLAPLPPPKMDEPAPPAPRTDAPTPRQVSMVVEEEEEEKSELPPDTMSDEELLRAVEAEEMAKAAADGEGKAMNRDIQKHLDDIMSSSTMSLRGGRRRSRRPGNSTSTISVGDNTPTSVSDNNGSGRKSSRIRSKRGVEKTQPSETGKEIGLNVEASQSVQITWDDPTSRREKEKIMARLKRADNESADMQDPGEDAQQVEEQTSKSKQRKSSTSTNGSKPEPEDTPPTPTPKAPPIRLPVAKPAVAPQLTEEKQQDNQSHEVSTRPLNAPPKFLFTGMGQEEKINYSALIEQLGGEVKDAQYFDASCSHIIVGNPTRNEKYLAALATGKWILHKSYLEACREANGFVEEEPHEWGNRTDLSKLSETGKKMALAATRWRARIQDQEMGGSSAGAFEGWKALLLVEKSKEMCFKRLLEAGGARVLAVRPPFTPHLDASHAFFDLHKVKVDADSVGLDEIVHSGVLCLKPEYIADFLVHDPSPDPQNFVIAEAKPILQRLVEQAGQAGASKRRASEMNMSPRTKRTRHR